MMRWLDTPSRRKWALKKAMAMCLELRSNSCGIESLLAWRPVQTTTKVPNDAGPSGTW